MPSALRNPPLLEDLTNEVAVTGPVAIIPLLAVIRPIESTLVTSSYVIVPPTLRLPLITASVAVTIPVERIL